MTDSWLDLAVPYFVPVCRHVFDAYFAAEGFGLREVDPAGRVTYADNRTFVELSYWLEDAPEFVPSVAIGLDALHPPTQEVPLDRIGLWYAVPTDSVASQYATWRFSDPQELEKVLRRIRDELISVYARPLWLDRDRLAVLIERRYQEVAASRTMELNRKRRAEANAAFANGDYRQARDLYRAIGVDNLSSLERKRLEIVDKRAGPRIPPAPVD